MKIYFVPFIFFCSTFFSASLFAGDNEQKIEAPITAVTVYLTGVEIAHEKTISLLPGRNELHFIGLTSKLVPKSIQFTAVGDVSVLAISNRIDYIYGQKKNDARLTQLNDSLALMQDAYSTTSGVIEAYQTEKLMLAANKSIGGNNTGVSAAEMKLNADFVFTRTSEINTQLVILTRKAVKEKEIIDRLTWQVNDANQLTNPPMGEIIVLVVSNAELKIESKVNLNYVASDAGWAPSYDLIAEDVDKNIDLKYRAKVFNNTNVDWKNVKMKLSTSNPMQSAQAPTLDKWTLNFDNGYEYNQNAYQQTQNNDGAYGNVTTESLSSQNLVNSAPAQSRAPVTGWDFQDDTKAQIVQPPVAYNQIQVSELSAEFDIKTPYDIPADGKPYIVDVTSYNLPATFQYSCTPKVEREAFLMARITGWEDLDLVEGPANVYFGGTYVGQSYIYTRSVDDTLDLSFGRDQKLVVTRTKLKEFNNEKSATPTKKETYSYEIDLKNTRKTKVHVELQDQVPVSQDAEIIVDVPEKTNGVLDPATGIITWSLDLDPGVTQKIILTYTVKYPKTKIVHTKKFRTTSCPAF